MASKVHPQVGVATAPTSSKQQVFTLWMKSLVMSSNGCAVFDSDGRIVCRVDNYDRKCSNRVLVMDGAGNVLFTIIKKKFGLMGRWEGYRLDCSGDVKQEIKPGFHVRRINGIKMMIMGFFKGYSFYKAVVRLNKDQSCDQYVMETHLSEPSCRIIDSLGRTVAEVKRKITKSGVVLGEDVLGMVVEPNVDDSLIMGLVVVFGLFTHRL